MTTETPVATNLNLTPLPEFNPDVEVGSSVSKKWERWLKDFKMYIVATAVSDNTRKRALLLYMVGSRVREIFENLVETGEENDFDTAVNKLTEYFAPQKNTRYEIYKFRQLKQEDGESLDAFHIRLRSSATNCEFVTVDSEIEQQIITGGLSTTIRKKALKNPDYKLKDMLQEGRRKEFSSYQSKDIEASLKEEVIEEVRLKKKSGGNSNGKDVVEKVSVKNKVQQRRACFNCGGEFPHKKICPAKGKQCERFGRYNHFSSCCMKRLSRDAPQVAKKLNECAPKNNEEMKNVRTKLQIDENSSDEDYLYLLQFSNKKQPCANINIKERKVKMTIDTGAIYML